MNTKTEPLVEDDDDLVLLPMTQADWEKERKAEIEGLRSSLGEFENEAQIINEDADAVVEQLYEDATHGIFQAHDGTLMTGVPIKTREQANADRAAYYNSDSFKKSLAECVGRFQEHEIYNASAQ
jgi:hypothetical protein